jgi:hypothetical protein
MRAAWVAALAILAMMILAGPAVRAPASPPASASSAGPPTELGPGTSPPVSPAPAVGGAQPYPHNPVKVRIEHVVHQGEQAFGLPDGFTFRYPGEAQIDCQGNVLFAADLSGAAVTPDTDCAVFYGQPGNMTKLLWESDPAPCMSDGVVVSDLYYACPGLSETAPDSTLDDSPGWIELTADISGPGITPEFNDRVIYVGPPDDLQPVLQGGDPAPGCDPGVYIDVSGGAGFGGRLSDHATLLVCAKVAGPGVTTLNNQAFWTGSRENLQLAARTGMQAPGCPGVTFWAIDLTAHNDAGQLFFRGTLRGSGVTSANDTGRWLSDPATGLTNIAREGDPVPWFGGSLSWKTVSASIGDINGPGKVGICGAVQGEGVTAENDLILAVGEPDNLDVLDRESDPLPEIGPDNYVAGLGNFWINNRDDIFYRIIIGGPGITPSNQCAIFFGPIGAASLALRDGDSAPGFPQGFTLASLANMNSISAMNDVGDVVGPTCIQGPGVVEDVNHVVLWMRHHVLQRWIPLLRSGDQIEGRIVYAGYEVDFAVTRSGGADGNPQSLNDAGIVLVAPSFTDGTYGIYRLTPLLADADRDGDLDMDDWALFPGCLDAPGATLSADCGAFDLNVDGRVDLSDAAMLQELFRPQP